MGSVQGYTDCPQCKWDKAIYETHTSGQEWLSCDRCGYYYSTWENPTVDKKGLGSLSAYNKSGGGTVGSYTTKKQLKEFIESVKSNRIEISKANYTYCKNGVYYWVNALTGDEVTWEEHELIEDI